MQKRPHKTGDTGQPPADLPVSTAHPELRYELAEDPGASPTDSESGDVAPVYRRVPSGEIVVPTGRVLVRFPEGDAAADHDDDLKSVGYVIDEVLSYAPHTAWVRATTGGVTAALSGLDELGKMPGVVALEPQMIGSSSKRE